ncbi:hypothetical protein [Sorangium sp. So ce693]|uniref:hypothetical protein n=1 Tax=Sorangium sp. So ce693 TaxID=3133318 RepID=UPI003F5FCE7B
MKFSSSRRVAADRLGVADPAEVGHGPDVYDARSGDLGFGALGALAYEPATGFLLATPDNAFARQRIWSFWPDHGERRMQLVREQRLPLRADRGAGAAQGCPRISSPIYFAGFLASLRLAPRPDLPQSR